MRIAKSAERFYVDPNALRALYVHDARSRAMSRWRTRHPGVLGVTAQAQTELLNAIALAVFRGEISAHDMASAIGDLDADFKHGRLVRVDVSFRRTLDLAAALSLAHTATIGTRCLDVIHVANAMDLGCRTIVTYDIRQAALARTVRLRVQSP